MVEYYLKYDRKNIKANISKLIAEIQTFFDLNNISVIETSQVYYNELRELISKNEFDLINNLYWTIQEHEKKYPFLKKYLKPLKLNENVQYRFADIFAGCGGLSLGLENAGFNCHFVNEIDTTYGETFYFNHHLPLSNFYVGDVNELINKIEGYQDIVSNLDLVCGRPTLSRVFNG